MKIIKTTSKLKHWLQKEQNGSIGFVPTMGALHEGHASLLRVARAQTSNVVLSILVNPTQFGDKSDLENYPQTLAADLEIAEKEGVDVVFAPSAEDLYGGSPTATKIDWGSITSDFEAAFRPGHFDGVVAVVDKLLTAVRPDVAFFGEKDLQQVAVIRKLAEETHPSVSIVSCDLIRDKNGLALSSRNTRISDSGKTSALELSKCLIRIASSADRVSQLEIERTNLTTNPNVELEYLNGVNEVSYSKSDLAESWTHIIIAAEVEGVRLIDNIRL